ncbi:MAG: IPTL-CTERM sorting domain-containing protein [Planctomycetes bacterium]|nr:IPTL-CTERM sorting domain-containing protein [Planctomycetota bacterium]
MTISTRTFIVVLVLAVAPARVALSQIPYACCFPDDTCQDIDSATCAADGGIMQGLALCGGTEACCGSTIGACYIADRVCCLANGDTPQGPGTACSAPEACCFGNNTCQMLDPLCCVDQGGTPQGPGSTCGGMEACCDSGNSSCYMADRTCCLANGDTPNGPGSVCTATAACCLSGTCEVLDPLCCLVRGGVPQAPGTTCGECGSCCLADKDCLDDIVNGTCAAVGGSFNGEGSICLGDSDGDGIDDQCENCIGVDDAIFGTFVCSETGLVCETDADCAPGETCKKACLGKIPTVSEWGLIVLSLLLLTAGKIYFGYHRRRLVGA